MLYAIYQYNYIFFFVLSLHNIRNIQIILRIEEYCNNYASQNNQSEFHKIDQLAPVVDTKSCFDDLRVGIDHVSRSTSDTYYVNDDMVWLLYCTLPW